MPSIEIIKLRNEHTEKLIRFFNEINSPDYIKDFSPHPFDEEHARRVCNYQGHDYYYSILLDRENIIGYFMLRGWDEGYDTPSIGLCVLKKYQGLGLGSLIMNFLEKVARLNGCSKVMLKVKKDNTVAKTLYVSHGYIFTEYNDEFLVGFKSISGE